MTHLLALFIVAQLPAGQSASACTGPSASIANVTTSQSTDSNGLDRYTLTIAVKNVGSQSQKSNVLQSVDIFLDHAKNGEKGVPPLRAGQTYSFTYDVQRAEDARRGSTSVDLRLTPATANSRNCSVAIEKYHVVI
jgi:archaellum component FlaG (FlaF/FlaG flagellin family)